MEANHIKVFVTTHAFNRLRERRLGTNKQKLIRQVRHAVSHGQHSTEAPDWYKGGKTTTKTRFVMLADHVCAIIERNNRGRGWVVKTVVN